MAVVSPILALVGPTASGKSALALTLARRTGAEILSVDSMQVYRQMDIGTAKPSAAERQEIPHHLIDVVEPDQTFTVARFVELADAVIADAAARNAPLIAVGGTPLYFKALFEGLFEGPGADESIRMRLRSAANEQLHRRLGQVDPAAAQRIHMQDTRRLIRALEVYELTGRPISSFQNGWSSGQQRHPAVWIGLSWDRDALNRRINARVKAMMASGWAAEVAMLRSRYGSLSPTAAQAAGYEQLMDHLAGRTTLDQATEQVKIATRQLARRQIKWLRRWRQVQWFDGESPLSTTVPQVLELWHL